MPITVRLSKKFYDRLGDDVIGELVDLLNQVDTASRTQLREINESNFARFDAKLEQRAAEILAKVDTKFAELRVEIHRANAATEEGVLRWMIGLWLTQMLAFAGLWFSRA